MSKINSGFLEHLRGDFASPRKSNGPLGDDSVLSDDEDAAGGSTPFPGIEGIDEVETGPQHRYWRIAFPRSQRVGDESKTLVVGKSGRSGMPGEQCNLLRCGINLNRKVVWRMLVA